MIRTVGIMVGRFVPFHKGHERILKAAITENDAVVIMIGRHTHSDAMDGVRSERCPYTMAESNQMIMNCVTLSDTQFVKVIPISDIPHDLPEEVSSLFWGRHIVSKARQALLGHYTHLDQFTYYTGEQQHVNDVRHVFTPNDVVTRLDPEYGFVGRKPNKVRVISRDDHGMSATKVRESLARADGKWKEWTHPDNHDLIADGWEEWLEINNGH